MEMHMKIQCLGINNGVFDDKYGKFGNQFNMYRIPSHSIPISFVDAPKSTVSFAFILIDHDSAPLCGFSWIHWIACNILTNEILENASINHPDFTQGVNSWYKADRDINVVSSYGGMMPPNAPHTYTLEGYALDCILPLKKGFTITQLREAMAGHILAQDVIKGVYRNK